MSSAERAADVEPVGHACGEADEAARVEDRLRERRHPPRRRTRTAFPNGKVLVTLAAGDPYVVASGGGGGFGPPAERPIDALREDVRQGYVTLEAAERDYGVTFEPDTLEVARHRLAQLPQLSR